MFEEEEILEILNCIGWKCSESQMNINTKTTLEKIIKEYLLNKEIQETAKYLLNQFSMYL